MITPQDETAAALIKATVAQRFGVTELDLISNRKSRRFAWPRQVAMFLCYRLTTWDMKQIGRAFRRDRTTVVHAQRAVTRRCVADPEVRDSVTGLWAELQAQLEPGFVREVTP